MQASKSLTDSTYRTEAVLLSDLKAVLIGLSLQLCLLFFAFALHHSILLYISFFNVAIWCLSIILVVTNNRMLVDYLSSLAWFSLIFTASVLFGIESGVHLLFWPLACIFITSSRVSSGCSIVFASFCVFAFINLSLSTGSENLFNFQSKHQLSSFALEKMSAETLAILMDVSTTLSILVGGGFLADIVLRMKTSFIEQRENLNKLAHTDPLTGIANRRYFISFIEKQNKTTIRKDNKYCIALGDVDHFKQINDTFGHDVGDIVLKKLAGCFNDILAQSDKVCRWGGEEFILFIPNSTLQEAYPVIESIREVVSDLQINDVKVTISFGLVESSGKLNAQELVKRADALLYKAKLQGRNNTQK